MPATTRIWIILLAFSPLLQEIQSLPQEIRIGMLYDSGDVKQRAAFRYAVQTVNSDGKLFGRGPTKLKPLEEEVPKFDSFRATKKVCTFLKSGVAAIFGPQSGQTSAHVQSICDAINVPHIETRWDYRLRNQDYSVNLYPHPSSLSKAYLALVKHADWKKFTILYESNVGLVKLQELLKSSSPNEFKITIRQLPEGNDFREILRAVKESNENNVILDCSTENVQTILKQAQQVNMITPYNSFIITSLDSHLVDLEDFKYSGTNITAVRLFDPETDEARKVMSKIQDEIARNTRQYREELIEPATGTETALMYDAVILVVKGLMVVDNSTHYVISSLNCNGDETGKGFTLMNYMKTVNMTGLTGLITFDPLGFRTEFTLEIVQLTRNGLEMVGHWNKIKGINYTKTENDRKEERKDLLRNKTLKVSFALNKPYIMLKEDTKELTGNDQYEGFCIDLLNEIASITGFNYTLYPVPNNAYGNKNANGDWNGMIKELILEKADIAITDLTITYDREEVVDFTMPFMNLGISILFRKPQKSPPSLFSFLSPLSLEVWMYMMSAYAGVSLLMYILARFTPYEWENPHPCNPDPDTLENQFTILNCLWFAIGSLMQQGCDFLPHAMSTRMVAGMWWFFTLIMISSYTANLAAFLTVERMESPIESAEDLSKQTKIKYGCVQSGSTRTFFQNSSIEIYKRMYEFMESDKNYYVQSNEEGVNRVMYWSEGPYALIGESTTIEYMIERHCNLTQIGGLLDSKSYGIALKNGASYKQELDEAILKLQEEGRLYILKQKWWKQRRGGGKCKEEAGKSALASELNLDNVGGVFVVLLGGMGLALFVALCEFVNECCNISKEDKKPLMQVLSDEMRFVFQCRSSVKPVRRKSAEDLDETPEVLFDSNLFKHSDRNALT